MPTVRLDKKKGPSEADSGLSPAKYSVLGYVFIKFYKSASAEKCLEAGHHEIGGKKIDVERAYIIEGSVNEALSKLQLKLFFRGFPAATPRSSLRLTQASCWACWPLSGRSGVCEWWTRTANPSASWSTRTRTPSRRSCSGPRCPSSPQSAKSTW